MTDSSTEYTPAMLVWAEKFDNLPISIMAEFLENPKLVALEIVGLTSEEFIELSTFYWELRRRRNRDTSHGHTIRGELHPTARIPLAFVKVGLHYAVVRDDVDGITGEEGFNKIVDREGRTV